MESKIKFNLDLESEGGKLYRQYCEEKGIEYSIKAGANFCLGYMAVKSNDPITAAADRISDKLIAIVKKQLGEPTVTAGLRWVKASEYDHSKGGILFYRFLGPTLKSCGTGNFSGGVFHGLVGDHFSKDEWEYLYILDESAGESDAVEFAEWAATIAFFDDATKLWELLGEGEAIKGQFRFTTKEFFELFKQQNIKV